MAGDNEFQQLLARAQQGDREALGEIYVRYLPHIERVMRFRLRKMGLERVTTTADIQDSVFCQLLRPGALDKITTDQHLRNFLIKACGNKVNDILARLKAGKLRAREAAPAELVDVSAAVDIPDQLEYEEELARIYTQLTPRERLLCMLRRAGCGWDEIAERLNTTPVGARQAFSRGLRRARELVRGPSPGSKRGS